MGLLHISSPQVNNTSAAPARVDQRRPVVRVRQRHRVSHDYEPPLGARQRHVEAPRVAHEAERALLVRASGREDHNVRFLALKTIDAAHAHALDAGASQRSTHLTNLLGVGAEHDDGPLLLSEKRRHDVHDKLGLGRVRKAGLVFLLATYVLYRCHGDGMKERTRHRLPFTSRKASGRPPTGHTKPRGTTRLFTLSELCTTPL